MVLLAEKNHLNLCFFSLGFIISTFILGKNDGYLLDSGQDEKPDSEYLPQTPTEINGLETKYPMI